MRVEAIITNTAEEFSFELVVTNDDGTEILQRTGKCYSYPSVITIEANGRKFAYATAYWEGTLPHEQVFEITVPDSLVI